MNVENVKQDDHRDATDKPKKDWRMHYDKWKHAKAMRLYRMRKKILREIDNGV